MLRWSSPRLLSAKVLRKRIKRLKKEEESLLGMKGKLDSMKPEDYLPDNTPLEAALTMYLRSNRDPRAHLHFLKQFVNCELISLASPVGPWDPFDMKPQVFALDKSFALPVFSNLRHLRTFCHHFQFSVRDPTGVLWADWRLPVDGVLEPSQQPLSSANNSGHTLEGATSQESERQSKGLGFGAGGTSEDQLVGLDRFGWSKCMALPTHGPFVKPYFYGYFADVHTVLYNISIVSEKVDVVLNPSTPFEFCIAREVTTPIVQKENVLLPAYQAVEAAVQSEFFHFFTTSCPEVMEARSAVTEKVTAQSNPRPNLEDRDFEISMIIHSYDYEQTRSKIAQAKKNGQLLGHSSLFLFPLEGVDTHLLNLSSPFYTTAQSSQHQQVSSAQHSSSPCRLPGRYRQMGTTIATIATDVLPSSYYSDPTLRDTRPLFRPGRG